MPLPPWSEGESNPSMYFIDLSVTCHLPISNYRLKAGETQRTNFETRRQLFTVKKLQNWLLVELAEILLRLPYTRFSSRIVDLAILAREQKGVASE